MRYWWVNQNQTWRHEIGGGYLWSPKTSRGGRFNQFYKNMKLVDAGDRVFSYYNTRIQHIGTVQRPALSGSKPSEFGLTGDYWDDEGWFVPVEWQHVPMPFRPKDIIEQLRPHLPEKYAPLKQDGDGLQSVYLAGVPKEMARVLLQRGAVADAHDEIFVTANSGADTIEQLDDAVEVAINNNTAIADTERDALIKARRGQGRFRDNLLIFEQRCRVTGVSDIRLLRAGHIKPWRSCASNHERLDGNNGLLLAPHIDLLFDRGYISFANDGQVMVSSNVDETELHRLGIRLPSNVGSFSPEQASYLDYHRREIFRL